MGFSPGVFPARSGPEHPNFMLSSRELSHILPVHMTYIFLLAGILIGIVATVLFDRSSLKKMERRVDSLVGQAEKDRAEILTLTAAAASVEVKDKIISERKDEIARLTQQIAELQERLIAKTSEIARLESQIGEREEALKKEREQLDQVKGTLKAEFAQLSSEALRNNGEKFLETAKRVLALQHQTAEGDLDKRKDEISNLVRPIQEGIKAVTDAAKEMETARNKAFGSIEEQLKNSIESAAEVAKQALALKDALKRPNVRGRWGEVQLRVCVELAGMEEHCDVEFQETSLTADDELIRPDMIVRMPGGRKIAVDSKAPMDHFLSYIDASTDEERQTALANHGKAVKSHAGNLAKTDYMRKIEESPDFVVMFLPNESFLAMALEKDPTLMEDALRKKVLVATPGTLIGLLKVVRYGWDEQSAADNAKLIVEEGSRLNTELARFLEDFAQLSLAIDSVNESFRNSKRRVENQIAKRSLALTKLNAKSTARPITNKKVGREVNNILRSAGADDYQADQEDGADGLALAAGAEEADDE